MAYAPMTELEAVNMMLKTIGEQPVNSIPLSGLNEATIAQSTLLETSREVQSWGLDCNTETDYPLTPATDGYIYVPSNALSVDPDDTSSKVVVRGKRLYDKEEHSYTFTDSVKVTVIFNLPFDELPQVVRQYVTIKSARKFILQMVGDGDTYKLTAKDEQDALVMMKRAELLSIDKGFLDGTFALGIITRTA